MGDEHFELSQPELRGVNWTDDSLFFTHTWTDETSQFDDHPSVRFAGDYYSRKFSVRVPKAFEHCDEMIDWFIDMMSDRYPEEEGFWVD